MFVSMEADVKILVTVIVEKLATIAKGIFPFGIKRYFCKAFLWYLLYKPQWWNRQTQGT